MKQERKLKIEKTILKELNEIILERFDPGEGVFVSIINVELTNNGSIAEILVNIWPSDNYQDIINRLNDNAFYFRKLLDDRIRSFYHPKLHFNFSIIQEEE